MESIGVGEEVGEEVVVAHVPAAEIGGCCCCCWAVEERFTGSGIRGGY